MLMTMNTANSKPYVMTVSSEDVFIPNKPNKATYNLCSRCYSVIDKTWDHSTWCELYKEEALSTWLKKGKK